MATNEKVVIFRVFGGEKGNQIPVSGGLAGDQNFEKRGELGLSSGMDCRGGGGD
jgi:hypothetical protein